MEEGISGFRVDFEVDSGKSFLVLTENGPGRPEIIGFQVEMIAKNKIPGVAAFNIRERDLEISFCYDISGHISLSNFFKRQKVNKSDFVKILQNITGTLTGCKNFLLNDKCFVMNENLIFINPKSLEVFLIYIPCCSSADIVDLFKSFVIDLVVKTANIETDDNFVQKVLGLIKEEHLCISDFNDAIKYSGGNSSSDEPILQHRDSGWQKSDCSVIPEAPQTRETLPFVNPKKAVNYVPGVLILVTILTLVAVKIGKVLVTVNIVSNNPGYFWGIGASVLAVILFAGIIIYVRVKRKGIDADEATPAINQLKSNQQETAASNEDFGGNEINLESVDETVILSSYQRPVLVGSGEVDSIVISKADFVIGRNLGTCDYAIQNKSIGRAHARIQNSDGKFYISDLDSKNGTFLNGDRLISNKQYELKPNDKVVFANLQFCFKIE